MLRYSTQWTCDTSISLAGVRNVTISLLRWWKYWRWYLLVYHKISHQSLLATIEKRDIPWYSSRKRCIFHVEENTEASTTAATHDRNGPSCILVDRILSVVVVLLLSLLLLLLLLLLFFRCYCFCSAPWTCWADFYILDSCRPMCYWVIELLSFLSYRFPYHTNSYFSNNWLKRWKRTWELHKWKLVSTQRFILHYNFLFSLDTVS